MYCSDETIDFHKRVVPGPKSSTELSKPWEERNLPFKTALEQIMQNFYETDFHSWPVFGFTEVTLTNCY